VDGAVAGSDLPEGKWRQLFAGYSLHAGRAAVEIATSAPLPHQPDQVREPKYRQASSRACPFNPAGYWIRGRVRAICPAGSSGGQGQLVRCHPGAGIAMLACVPFCSGW